MRGLAPVLLLSLAALSLGRWVVPGLSVARQWLWAPAVALGGGSILFFWWRLAGLPAGSLSVPLFGLALLLSIAPRDAPSPRLSRHSVRWTLGRWSLVAAIGVALLVCSLRLLRQPLGEYDAIAIWNSRALTIWRADESMGPLFSRMTLSHAHPDYPLLVPGAIAASFSLAGGESIVIPQVVSLTFLFAAAGVVRFGAGHFAGEESGRMAAALFLLTPEVLYWGPAQCADLAVAYLLALGAFGLARELEPGKARSIQPGILTGFVLSLLPWAKNEGLLLLAVLLAAWVLAGLSGRSLRWKSAGALALGGVPGLATVTAFKISWSPHAELPDFLRGATERMLDTERWRTVAGAFIREANPLGAGSEWGGTVLLLLVLGGGGALLNRQRGADRWFLRIALAGCLCLWAAVYLGTPADLQWHLTTSLDRLLLQLLPLTAIWAFCELEWHRTEPNAS